MIRDVLREMLHFLHRYYIDVCEMVSSSVRNVIQGNSSTLPLRHLKSVELYNCEQTSGQVKIERDAYDYASHEELCGRLRNAYIGELAVCFMRDGFLRYWRTCAGMNCRVVNVVCCGRHDTQGDIDEETVRFVAETLKTDCFEVVIGLNLWVDQTTHVSRSQSLRVYNEPAARNSIRLLAVNLDYKILLSAMPQLMSWLTGARGLEFCYVFCCSDPYDWINSYIETFERAEDASTMVPSLLVLWAMPYVREYGMWDRLWSPSSNGVRPPITADIVHACRRYARHELNLDYYEKLTSEQFAFENRLGEQRLDVYRWTFVEQGTQAILFHIT